MKHDIDYLQHHGVLGQKWGIRRYQNKDGTLTELGKKGTDKFLIQIYCLIMLTDR